MRIRELRKSRGLTQEQMAKILGIKQQSMMRYERDPLSIKLGAMIPVADYFHTTLDYLAERTFSYAADNQFLVCEENLALCNLTEAHLLHLYRQLPKKSQYALIEFLGFIEKTPENSNRFFHSVSYSDCEE